MGRSASTLPRRCTHAILNDIWSNYDMFIFDADGVLWTGDTVIDGAVQLFKKLLSSGKDVVVVTNNATKKVESHVEKFERLGFEGMTKDNVINSGIVCAHEIRRMKNDPANADRSHLPVYLLGSLALRNTLEEFGIESIGFGHDRVVRNGCLDNELELSDFVSVGNLPEIFAVVSSYDRYLNLDKLSKATNFLVKNPTVHFIATNEDMTFPKNPNEITLGAGIISTNLRITSGRNPIVMGKPDKAMWNYISEKFGEKIRMDRTIMIGDRCDTDILFGNNNNLDTLLVLSGVTKDSHIIKIQEEGKFELLPKYFTDSVKDLLLE